MLVRICDFCGDKLDLNNFVKLEGGFIRSTEKYKNKHNYKFGESDICLQCAKSRNLMQIIEIIKKVEYV